MFIVSRKLFSTVYPGHEYAEVPRAWSPWTSFVGPAIVGQAPLVTIGAQYEEAADESLGANQFQDSCAGSWSRCSPGHIRQEPPGLHRSGSNELP